MRISLSDTILAEKMTSDSETGDGWAILLLVVFFIFASIGFYSNLKKCCKECEEGPRSRSIRFDDLEAERTEAPSSIRRVELQTAIGARSTNVDLGMVRPDSELASVPQAKNTREFLVKRMQQGLSRRRCLVV